MARDKERAESNHNCLAAGFRVLLCGSQPPAAESSPPGHAGFGMLMDMRYSMLLLMLFSPALFAEDNAVLQYDAVPALKGGVHFQHDDALLPKQSNFRVLDFAPLSSEQGERWAVVTLHNDAGGQRILQDNYLVAEFADGSRRHALDLDGKAEAGETFSRTINFGYSRFPVLRIFAGTE